MKFSKTIIRFWAWSYIEIWEKYFLSWSFSLIICFISCQDKRCERKIQVKWIDRPISVSWFCIRQKTGDSYDAVDAVSAVNTRLWVSDDVKLLGNVVVRKQYSVVYKVSPYNGAYSVPGCLSTSLASPGVEVRAVKSIGSIPVLLRRFSYKKYMKDCLDQLVTLAREY